MNAFTTSVAGRAQVGHASVALDARRSVPDAFRQLAEREL